MNDYTCYSLLGAGVLVTLWGCVLHGFPVCSWYQQVAEGLMEGIIVNRLSLADKVFYNKSYDVDLKLMDFPEVEEFLYWVNRGVNPLELSSLKHEWSEDGIVSVALSIYFSDNRPLSDAIDYLADNIR